MGKIRADNQELRPLHEEKKVREVGENQERETWGHHLLGKFLSQDSNELSPVFKSWKEKRKRLKAK